MGMERRSQLGQRRRARVRRTQHDDHGTALQLGRQRGGRIDGLAPSPQVPHEAVAHLAVVVEDDHRHEVQRVGSDGARPCLNT